MASTKKPKGAEPKEADRLPFSARLTPGAKARLDALAYLTQENAYVLLENAFWTYWNSLPPADRDSAESMAKAREKRESGG